LSLSALPLGEKLRLIRKDRGLSLENIAHGTGCSVATLSRLERGEADVDNDVLTAIRKTLDVENAPLLEEECTFFESRLWLWNDLLASDRLQEAKEIQQEMSSVLQLPYIQNISLLYSLTEARMIYYDSGNIQLMQEKMEAVDTHYSEMKGEARCLFYYNKASLSNSHNNFKEAINHYTTALECIGDNLKSLAPILLVNLGACYGRISRPFHAVLYFERASQACFGDLTSNLKPTINIQLSVGYRAIGELKKAKQHTTEALAHAKRVKYSVGIGVCYCNYAEIGVASGNYEEALGFCDQSLEQLKDEERQYDLYLNALYLKACILLELRRFTELSQLAKQGVELSKDFKTYALLFESVAHLATLKNSESEDFIESVTIPSLIKKNNTRAILFYSNKLEEHFRKKRSNKRAMNLVEISRDIYRSMTMSAD